MKRLALALALISSTLLSGCIIVPARGYHGGYHHDHDDDRGYGDAYGYDRRGPR